MKIRCAVLWHDFNFDDIAAPETICRRCGYPWKACMKQLEKEQSVKPLTRTLKRETWYIGVALWVSWWIGVSLLKGESDQWALGSLMAVVWFPMMMDRSSGVK